ncbi:MAG: putative transcriptional regulator [Flavobacteriales bacterium]|jgi:putative transcriptional regulator
MKTNFHPDDAELFEYSAGSSSWAISIAIASHLHFCSKCKARVASLNELAGEYVGSQLGAPVADDTFAKTMAMISHHDSTSFPIAGSSIKSSSLGDSSLVQHDSSNTDYPEYLPKVLRKIMLKPRELHWKKISKSLQSTQLTTGQNHYEVCLHKIKRGGSVIEHDHNGAEVVVVLDGSFSDLGGTYNAGDYLVRGPGEPHRPTAAMNQDCICLSIAEAPVKLKGLLGLLMNPFLRIHPA